MLIVQGLRDIQVSIADAQALHAANPSSQLALLADIHHERCKKPAVSGGFSVGRIRVRRLFGVNRGTLWLNPAILCERFQLQDTPLPLQNGVHPQVSHSRRCRFDFALFHIPAAHIPSMVAIAAGRSPGARYVPHD
jgi:hypothetical protein